jgi:hypothetical protein
MTASLLAMPVVDIRVGGILHHAVQFSARAYTLREACLASFPRILIPFLPALDQGAQRWLNRSRSPYVTEIAQVAAVLGFSGVWLLNSSYLWSCTSTVRDERGIQWMARTLDWPFPGLGRHADVVRAQGPAGEYFNVTWPGYAGVLTAMAPFRFAACINQAPMWRRTQHPWLRLYDIAANGLHTLINVRDIPVDHLLRQVFESCETYTAAKVMLEKTPVARPAIYTLVGCAPGERCVIERTENGSETRLDNTSAANDWVPSRPMWDARMLATNLLELSSAEASARCSARRDALASWNGRFSQRGFAWVEPPVLNPYTRLAVTMCPARGILRAAGYEITGAGLPSQVTEIREVVAPKVM